MGQVVWEGQRDTESHRGTEGQIGGRVEAEVEMEGPESPRLMPHTRPDASPYRKVQAFPDPSKGRGEPPTL